MGNRRLIGRSFVDPFSWDGFVDELSADPASGGSRSNRLIEILARQKLRAFPSTNGI